MKAVFPLAALLLSGCVATQRDVLELESHTDELKQHMAELKKTIASMQANQADLSVQIKRLHEDISTYTETARDTQGQMQKLSSKLDDLGVSVEQKVSSIGDALTSQQAKSLAEQKDKANPSELFNTAEVRLGVKDYDLAAKGFEEYVQKYPKGALIDVAVYKLGQSYFGMNKWESAGRQFALVLDKYPSSEMTASSRLMYALCLLRMKKNVGEAKQYLESVTADFPKSPEAKAAAAELKKLAKKD